MHLPLTLVRWGNEACLVAANPFYEKSTTRLRLQQVTRQKFQHPIPWNVCLSLTVRPKTLQQPCLGNVNTPGLFADIIIFMEPYKQCHLDFLSI